MAHTASRRASAARAPIGVVYDQLAEPVITLTAKGRQYLDELARRPAGRERRRPGFRVARVRS